MICQASAADQQALASYGMHLGTAFQLIDDVLDLTGDGNTIGKNLGDDIAEGKPTLPLLYAMRHGNASQAQLIRNAIQQGGADNIQSVIQAVQQTDALQHVRQLAQQEAAQAGQAIAHFAESPAKQALIDLAEFAVQRDF